MSRVEGKMSRVEGRMSRVEGRMSRVQNVCGSQFSRLFRVDRKTRMSVRASALFSAFCMHILLFHSVARVIVSYSWSKVFQERSRFLRVVRVFFFISTSLS